MKEAQQAEYIQNTSTLIPVCVHTFPYRLHNINNRVTKNVTLLSSKGKFIFHAIFETILCVLLRVFV